MEMIEGIKDEPPLKKRKLIKAFNKAGAPNALPAAGATNGGPLCPLTREPMADPVRFACEATRALDPNCYERKMIERWLVEHRYSPMTKNHLDDITLESVPASGA